MNFLMNKLTIAAPAKLNLHLEVLNKRKNGFHDLKSVFLAVNFGDTLHFEPLDGEKTAEIAVKGLNLDIPPEKNIIFRALCLFRKKTSFANGLKITVEKRIPSGGGLGGGSSDAAAALLALNEMADYPLSRAALLDTAEALGSDVPFFIYRTAAALVTGRGDIIEPFKAPRLFFVLVNPGFPSDTAAAFRLLDEYRVKFKTPHKEARRREIEGEVFSDLARWSFWNDFLAVFGERERSVYDEIIGGLRELGAGFAGLSGTGSTCFGVFTESESAQRAAEALRGKWNFVEYCGTWSEGAN